MNCPKCNTADVKVLDSRDAEGGHVVRRRRACEQCQNRFTTYERLEKPKLIVVKRDHIREPYVRDKIAHGLWRALEKRPVTRDQVEQLLDELEEQLVTKGETEIQSREIGEMVMDRLRTLDEVAYIRFASVYKSFKDIASFRKELSSLEE